ncbi:MAG: phosphoribosylformylglycinamidine cyclo-ligase [Armatimonadetes bacterium]|nr:phosphoribosylformylglycinamidine cyclo-ligase [Armatimonadota bacterium]
MSKEEPPQALSYADSGVDRDAATNAVERIKQTVRSTFTPNVLTDLGSFGALFRLDATQYREPVLVSSTDGVGTKLKIAFEMNRHDTIGIDLVAMCANDVLAQGAKPLFFLDYFASSKMVPERFEQIVAGIAAGCREAGCALIGGENAELPGFYQVDEYDLAGFCVGIVDKDRIIDGSSIEPGDVVLGLASSGLHSNGYSLARKVLLEVAGLALDQPVEGLAGSLGEELLKPTRLYIKPVLSLLEALGPQAVKGIAHITGGGLIENIPRMLPEGTQAEIHRGKWTEPPIFELIQRLGNVVTDEMFQTFNMGIGMVLVTETKVAEQACHHLDSCGTDCSIIGRIVKTDETPSCVMIEH